LAGVAPTHLDSHQHLHVVPGISAIVLRLARRFSIRAARVPAEPLAFFGGMSPSPGRVAGRSGLTLLARVFRRQAVAAGIAATGNFFGMLAGGQMSESKLVAILRGLPEGDSEIMVHPGERDAALAASYPWGYRWDEELGALCAAGTQAAVQEQQVQLISYREL
jgi:chitin disaccharide deacetylase